MTKPKMPAPTQRELLQLAAQFWPEGCEPLQAVPFARAALARWGRLAESEPEGPTKHELFRLLMRSGGATRCVSIEWIKPFARAVLARWGNPPQPAPEKPTVMEIIALADEIEESGLGQVDLVQAALARWGRPTPQPIPVSERLPGPGDCFGDGWAWFFNPRIGWQQAALPVSPGFSHWLPGDALPLPTHTSENVLDP